jgi:hypothetical protein
MENTQPVNTAELSEPIVKGGGDSPTTWDELEAVSRFKKEVKKVEKKEDNAAEKEVSKPSKKEASEKESSKEAGPAKKDVSKSKDEPEKAAEKRRIKVKHGETDLDLDLDIELPVKVDGKESKIKLQEALSNYSSRKHLDERYQGLKKELQDFQSQREQLNSIVKRAQESLKAKDFRGFMEMVAQATGEDARELYSNTVQNLRQQLEEAAHLSPEERKLKEVEEELNFYKQKEESAKAEATRKQQFQTTREEAEAVMAKSGIGKDQFIQLFDELVSFGYKPNEITPKHIADYHKNFQVTETVVRKLEELNPEAGGNKKLILRISEDALKLGLSLDDIKAAIEQEFGNKNAKALNEKIKDKQRKARAEQPMRNPDKDPIFFGDL